MSKAAKFCLDGVNKAWGWSR